MQTKIYDYSFKRIFCKVVVGLHWQRIGLQL